MTVRAADFAFLDFPLYQRRASLPCVASDVAELLTLMVELENDRIGLTAIHTRVEPQVFLPVSSPLPCETLADPLNASPLCFTVRDVVRDAVRRKAGATPILDRSRSTRLSAEVSGRLGLAASSAAVPLGRRVRMAGRSWPSRAVGRAVLARPQAARAERQRSLESVRAPQ
jgi:hypothetical protein